MPPKTGKVNELIQACDALVALLGEDNQWGRWMQRAAQELRAGRVRAGAQSLLGMYGGMGSFTDVPLSPEEQALSSKIYDLAKRLR